MLRLRTLAFATFLVSAVTDWRLRRCFLALMTATHVRKRGLLQRHEDYNASHHEANSLEGLAAKQDFFSRRVNI